MHTQKEPRASPANQGACPAGHSDALRSGQENSADLTLRAQPPPAKAAKPQDGHTVHRRVGERTGESRSSEHQTPGAASLWAYKGLTYIPLFLKQTGVGFLSLSTEEVPTKIKSLVGAGVQARKASGPLSPPLPTPTPVLGPPRFRVQRVPGESWGWVPHG